MSASRIFELGAGGRGPGARIGTWLKIPSLVTLEVVSQSEFDFVIVDLEHSPISLEWVHTACAVAQANGTAVLVRMPDAGGRGIQRVLDLGVDGVVIPQLHDAAETASVIASAMFPPHGRRGMGMTSRAGRWGTQSRDDYLDRGQRNTVRCIQFETAESFDNLEEILDVPGVNAVLLGPADLAVALGVQPGDRVLAEFAARLIDMANDRSVPCGSAVASPTQAGEAILAGFDFVVVGNDATAFAVAMMELASGSASAVATLPAREQANVPDYLGEAARPSPAEGKGT